MPTVCAAACWSASPRTRTLMSLQCVSSDQGPVVAVQPFQESAGAVDVGADLDDSGCRRGLLLIALCRFSAVVSGWRVPAVTVLADVPGTAPAPTAPGRAPFRVAGTGRLVRRVLAGRRSAARSEEH